MKEAVKSLASKSQVGMALDIADKYCEKIKRNFRRLSYFNGKSYLDHDGSQNYLTFQPIYNTFTMPAGNA